MASIGSVTTDILRGNSPAALLEQVATWETPGIDGVGALSIGKNGGNFAYTAIRYGSTAAAETFLSDLENLQGTVVSITDDFGEIYGSLLILSVVRTGKIAEIGNGGARAEAAVSGRRIL